MSSQRQPLFPSAASTGQDRQTPITSSSEVTNSAVLDIVQQESIKTKGKL